MFDSPVSLQEACVDFICDNLEAVCETTYQYHQSESTPGQLEEDVEDSTKDEKLLRAGCQEKDENENTEAGTAIAKIGLGMGFPSEAAYGTFRVARRAAALSSAPATPPQVPSTPRLVFRDRDAFLPSEISERLLSGLCERGRLTDMTLSLFSERQTRLRTVRIRNARLQITARGLRFLRNHKIVHLEATGLRCARVSDVVSALGEWSIQNLRSLGVSQTHFGDVPPTNSDAQSRGMPGREGQPMVTDQFLASAGSSPASRCCGVISLSRLRHLRHLDVSGTEFNRHGLEVICEDLPFLESLDISSTHVSDVSPLRRRKHTLRSLAMYNVRVCNPGGAAMVISELHQLRHLDLSDEPNNHPFEVFAAANGRQPIAGANGAGGDNNPSVGGPIRRLAGEILSNPQALPLLESLDVSGREEVEGGPVLRTWIEAHPLLRYIGLVQTEACYDETFTNPLLPSFRPNLAVSGTAMESQILEALRRYSSRPLYVQKCLYNLFRLTPTFSDARVDVIKLVLPGMSEHRGQFGVQMAATACLYNLTKGDLAQRVHPKILREVVHLTLTAMETYPNHFQLQKNTLLTLCSDRILQDVAFDKFRCARLVMECLCAFDDASMNRMSVAICSILAAKISTHETSLLGERPKYMHKLLSIVKSKVDAKSVDITMKFTLSALWNLTDESPATCHMFLAGGGMELFLEVLETFHGDSTVETKVLGLVNNIAEVAYLRERLMVNQFMEILRQLLHSKHIDVSYFAAGIIAHLASGGEEQWTLTSFQREDLLNELGSVVLEWETPEGEMVAYRSFHPFLPLLSRNRPSQVQLWAVWAIQHVCTKNAKRYCPMLVEEGGDEILCELVYDEGVDPSVRSICQSILQVLSTEGFSEHIPPQLTGNK